MVIFSKTKSHPKTVVNFESILESVKSNEGFCSKCCQSGNLAERLHTNNQQECIGYLKTRNKNERECKKYRLQLLLCVKLLKFFICSIAQINHFVMYKNGSIVKN